MIAILDPSSLQPKLFGLNTLPFGATGRVTGFLGVGSALFSILKAGLKVWCSAFDDDFPALGTMTLTDNTEKFVGLLFDLLGIQYAQSVKKCLPFAEEMGALGLVVDLRQFGQRKVFIRHAPERQQELLDRLTEILGNGSPSPKEAESLKGRIQWYESYLFVRITYLAIHRIDKRALSPTVLRNTELDSELEAAGFFLQDRVSNGSPLELTARTELPLLVPTDGAFEADRQFGSVCGMWWPTKTMRSADWPL